MNNELSPSDLSHFEKKLRSRMDVLRQEVADARERRSSGEQYTQLAGEAHDAGDASVASLTVDTTSADIRRDEEEIREISEALNRMTVGSFGICVRCGKPVERARLEVQPHAKRHVACQEADERESGTATRTPTL